MQNITSAIELKEAILQLENKQATQLNLLDEQLRITYNSLRPKNILKDAVKETFAVSDLGSTILNIVMGLAAGYLSKTAYVYGSVNPIKKLMGALLQFGVTNIIAKNADDIKAIGLGFLKNNLKKQENSKYD